MVSRNLQLRFKTASKTLFLRSFCIKNDPQRGRFKEVKTWDYSTSKSILTVILAVFHLLEVLNVPLQE